MPSALMIFAALLAVLSTAELKVTAVHHLVSCRGSRSQLDAIVCRYRPYLRFLIQLPLPAGTSSGHDSYKKPEQKAT